jgi:hypothetical protein
VAQKSSQVLEPAYTGTSSNWQHHLMMAILVVMSKLVMSEQS